MAKHMSKAPMHQASASKACRRGFVCFSAVVSLFVSVYLEFAYEIAGAARTGVSAGLLFGSLTAGCLVRLLGAFAVLFAVLWLLSARTSLVRWAFRYRYPLAAGVLALLVLLEVNGSSIGMWGSYFSEDMFRGVMFGMPRSVRSDEWLVLTPFSFSQQYAGYGATSSIIRGCATDVTVVYGQPAWALATLFRPFLWGHLVLGPAKGLSFFWCGRAIGVFLASFECMRVLAGGRKDLAVYGALLVGFSPILEWWFAVNGIAELLIFGQGLYVAFHYLLRATSVPRRIAWALAIAWFLGCFALVIYPAWQVCLAYVFGCLAVSDLCLWLADKKGARGRAVLGVLPYMVPAFVLFAISVGACLYASWDVVQTVLNTAYPGKRISTGGGMLSLLLNSFCSPLLSLYPDGYAGNACEGAGFISLFPLGVLLAAFVLARGIVRHKPDKTLVALLVPYAFFLVYGLAGFPEILAKITLMGRTTSSRVLLALGYLDVALLIRGLAVLWEARARQQDESVEHGKLTPVQLVMRGAAALGVAALFVLVAWRGAPEYMGGKKILLFCVFALLLVPLVLPARLYGRRDYGQGMWLATSALVVVAVGMCVNPVVRGIDVISQSSTIASIRSVVDKDPDALWAGDWSVEGQALIMAGAPSISSVNVYPSLERWRSLDPTGEHDEQYNRYAHIVLAVGDATSFENPSPDVLFVTLSPQDLLKLGATYWLSGTDLSSYQSDVLRFEPVRAAGPYTIYRIVPT